MFDRFEILREAGRAARRTAGRVHTPNRNRERSGHRRDYGPRRERVSMDVRTKRAMSDLGYYRVASVSDISREHFGGNAFTTRRAIAALKHRGLVEEHTAHGPKGQPFKVLTVTETGARAAGRYSEERGLDPDRWTRQEAGDPP